jgi:hypothetical protein
VLERRPRFFVTTHAAQELRPGRMQVAVIAELERVDELERPRGRACLGTRHRAIQSHHRGAGQLLESFVEHRDLVPVDLLLGLERGDRRL